MEPEITNEILQLIACDAGWRVWNIVPSDTTSEIEYLPVIAWALCEPREWTTGPERGSTPISYAPAFMAERRVLPVVIWEPAMTLPIDNWDGIVAPGEKPHAESVEYARRQFDLRLASNR